MLVASVMKFNLVLDFYESVNDNITGKFRTIILGYDTAHLLCCIFDILQSGPMITELGSSINATLQKLFKGQVNDETVENSLKEICTSLIRSNANPELVSRFRLQIKEQIEKEKIDSNANKAKSGA
ncbi:uncharacterized protein VICG_01711 [Vittaforma corneae ATCC 50505]|uniref:Signal recognition particle SRP54 helical bundle domain-containing protein n=1 Tax=Vittaforma corneae (strain ATCC 50505) TaxID=993615 RepID=L2GLR2_VITCO|nr:uncharacterized protein VICG_01711 [Vittaforma corneae ATCC 50505]ELA41222.1 hypothetical protein VICG_01711 [Vittaforma corneae ATCC 50505]